MSEHPLAHAEPRARRAFGENAAMKLATYKDGSRDGQLVVVSRDLALAQYATHIANRLQQVLDDWNYLAPQLQDVYDALNAGRGRHAFPFDPAQCMAPLPRAYQRVQAAAYAPHTAGIGAGTQDGTPTSDGLSLGGASEPVPRIVHHSGDAFLGPQDPIVCTSEVAGVDFGAGLAVVTGDIAAGCSADHALQGVRLLLLSNELSLSDTPADPDAASAGVAPNAVPRTVPDMLAVAFGPVAVTPDELGVAWNRGRVQLALECAWNGRTVGRCDAGSDMEFHFGQLLAHLASVRPVQAGSIVGTGPVRNRGQEKNGRLHWPKGYSCIADKRAMETLLDGQPSTPFLRVADRISVDMKTEQGGSVFGAIDHVLVAAQAAAVGRRRVGVQALAT
jgi:fumarylacetoacetate (FAA) hydrolase